jgi:hypothetical protein
MRNAMRILWHAVIFTHKARSHSNIKTHPARFLLSLSLSFASRKTSQTEFSSFLSSLAVCVNVYIWGGSLSLSLSLFVDGFLSATIPNGIKISLSLSLSLPSTSLFCCKEGEARRAIYILYDLSVCVLRKRRLM